MVKVIDNFLDNELFSILSNMAKTIPTTFSSEDIWENDLGYGNTLMSKPFINNNDFVPLSIISFQNQLSSYLNVSSKLNSTFYNWNNSNITWHYDDGYEYGTTFYLNKHWDKDWGGELLLKDNTFIKPEPNRLVIIKTPYEHKTCITSPDAPNRLTIQTFI